MSTDHFAGREFCGSKMLFLLLSVEFRYYNVCINITEAIGILYILAIGLGSQIHKDSLSQCNTQLGSLMALVG